MEGIKISKKGGGGCLIRVVKMIALFLCGSLVKSKTETKFLLFKEQRQKEAENNFLRLSGDNPDGYANYLRKICIYCIPTNAFWFSKCGKLTNLILISNISPLPKYFIGCEYWILIFQNSKDVTMKSAIWDEKNILKKVLFLDALRIIFDEMKRENLLVLPKGILLKRIKY